MLSSLRWIPVSAVKAIPTTAEEEEEENVKDEIEEEEEEDQKEDDENEEKKDKMDEEEQTLLKKWNMDTYDDEDATEDVIFGDEMKNLMINGEEFEDDGDDSEADDLIIKPTDRILIGAHSEEELSHLDIYIYEEAEKNLYVHHDILLGSFPISLAWLDYHPTQEGNKGNLIAVGTFDPQIEVWDLDILEPSEPTIILGGEAISKESKKDKNPKKMKNKPKSKFKKGSHTQAVMALSWNTFNRNYLASGSADETVKVWDLSNAICLHTLEHHKDKVQVVAWNPKDAAILLTGGFDKKISVLDARSPEKEISWKISSEVECGQWNPFDENQFIITTEEGEMICFDSRKPKKFLWNHSAHTKAVSGLSFNTSIQNYIATASVDKFIKLWEINNGDPKLIFAFKKQQTEIFSLSFCEDSPYLLAAGLGTSMDGTATSESSARLKIFNTRKFCKKVHKLEDTEEDQLDAEEGVQMSHDREEVESDDDEK